MSVSDFAKKCYLTKIEIVNQDYNQLILIDTQNKKDYLKVIDLYGDCKIIEISSYVDTEFKGNPESIISLVILEAE